MSAAWQAGGRGGGGGIETYSPFAPPEAAAPAAPRPDGRAAGSLRPPGAFALRQGRVFRQQADSRRAVVNFGLISQAAGSAYVELGHTKVLCGVCVPPRGRPARGAGLGG
jgi:hypothetical protein